MSRLSVYEGCEPYIFISYAHRNSELVMPIIERLIADGYRVWYDDGIVPGSEWDEYIADHIEKSSCVISMLSKEYIGSKNCKDELKFARNVNKEQFLIYLSPTSLTKGMQMRLDTLQAVFKYAYENEDDFYDKLYEAEMLECCNVNYDPASKPVTDNAREEETAEIAEYSAVPPKKRKKAGKIIVMATVALLLAAAILFVAVGDCIPFVAPYAEYVQGLLGFHKDTPDTETSDTPPGESVAPSTNPPNTEDVGAKPPDEPPETAETNETIENTVGTLKNEMYGITVFSDKQALPADGVVHVDEIKEGTEHNLVSHALPSNIQKFHAFDISMTRGSVPYSPDGEITVTLALPDDIDGAKAAVYYISDGGVAEEHKCNVSGGRISFVTNHFSIYVIAEKNVAEFSYAENGDGTLTITGYNGDQNAVIIPENIDGKTVTAIGAKAFDSLDHLVSVTIPNGVTGIGANAFYGCTSIQSLTIPVSVTSMGVSVFYGWSSTQTIVVSGRSENPTEWNSRWNDTSEAHIVYSLKKISFKANGGEGSMADIYAEMNHPAMLPACAFKKAGYSFAGWATASDGKVVATDTFNMGSDDSYILYAVWVPNENKLHFDPNGGSGEMPPLTIQSDHSATLPANTFEKEGCTFLGWSTDKSANVSYADKAEYLMGTGESYTLYAVWGDYVYRITYNLGGGQNNAANPDGFKKTTAPITLKDPSRKGYTFKGWYTDAGYSNAVTVVDTTKMADVTLWAKWEVNTYTITLDTNGAEACEPISVAYGAAYTLPTPTRDGYTFLGWYSGTTEYKSGTWTMTDDLALTAKWSTNNYTIEYNLAGGAASTTLVTKYSAESDAITLPTPTRKGYTFLGWTGTGLSSATLSVTIPTGSFGDRSYVATWKVNTYTITLDTNGAEACEPLSVTYGSAYTLPTPTRDGYTFAGWFNGETQVVDGTWLTASNMTLTARWTTGDYTIKYNLAGGTVTTNFVTEYNVESPTITLPTPTKKGYTFLGWTGTGLSSATLSVTIPTGSFGDRSYVATWKVNTYTLTLDTNGGKETYEPITVTYGTAYNLPTPTRDGYTFNGWYKGYTKYESGTWLMTENLAVQARWTAKTDVQYTVNHYWENIEDDGYTLYEAEILTGATDAKVRPETKTYDYFIAPHKEIVTIAGDGSTTVHYYYKRTAITVTLVENGGDEMGDLLLKHEATFDDPVPTREGYTFGGWFTDVALTEQLPFLYTSDEDFTVYAYWEEENKPCDFSYTVYNNYSSIWSFDGTAKTMWIPAYIGGKPVSIGSQAFENQTNLQSVTISAQNTGDYAFRGLSSLQSITILSDVKSISQSSFSGCINLTSIEIPGSVTSIGDSAFQYCENLQTITLHDGVTSIGNYAFYECTSLTQIHMSTAMTNIGYGAFRGCSSLQSIVIPNGVTSIGEYAFSGCKGLTQIEMPTNMTSLGASAFSGCSSLQSIIIPNGVTSIGDYAFYACTSLVSVEIPDGVTSIGDSAFSGCKNLQTVALPDSVTSIGASAFYECTSLTQIQMPTAMTNIGYGVFRYCSSLQSIVIPNGVTSIDENMFERCTSLTSIEIPGSVETIGEGAFINFQNLQTVILHDGVKSIGQSSFSGCINLTSIEIPGSVTSIGDSAFQYCENLQTITLHDGVTSIGNYAFYECTSLTQIHMSTAMTNIGYGAFRGCSSLQSIVIPNGVTSIGEYAFSGCKGLTQIEMPTNMTSLGASAFRGCSSLQSIVIPNGVKSIGVAAFSECTSLADIEIPGSVTSIEDTAFQYCENLQTITLPDSVTSIGASAFYECTSLTQIQMPTAMTNIGYGVFRYCSSLQSIVIPNGVTSISESLFEGCTNLASIEIPGSVETIGERAFSRFQNLQTVILHDGVKSIGQSSFYGCINLTSIEIPGSVTSMGDSAFAECDNLQTVTILDGVTTIGNYAFNNCINLQTVTIPGSVTNIGDSAFQYCENLQTITLPDSVTSIGEYAFSGCKGLTQIEMPTNMTSLGAFAFNGCSSLQSIIIPNGVTSIGEYAFYACTSLVSVEIPDGVTSIGDSAFSGCTNLQTVALPDSVTSIGNSAFYECTSLTQIQMPTAMTNIGYGVFRYCSSLQSIVIPDGVTSIDENMFERCTSLTSIEIPGSVETIGERAFSSFQNLQTVILHDGVKSIGQSSFYGCINLTSIEIPGSVTSMGNSAFAGCDNLQTVTILDGVTTIGNSAFNNCINLQTVTIPGSVTNIGEYAFQGCKKLQTITLPDSVTSIGDSAFYGCTSLTQIQMPPALTNFGIEVFRNCSSLQDIIIPNGVTSIGEDAFYACTSLVSVEIPDGVTSIGDSAFSGCKNLQTVALPDSVTSIGNSVFRNCIKLQTVTLPESVTVIDNYAFSECTSLTQIHMSTAMTNIGGYAFYECGALTNITFTGTMEQWATITKVVGWNSATGAYTIHCTDGDIPK